MIVKPNAEELEKKCKNRYELSIIIAKRSRQLIEGNVARVKTDEKSEITIASLEFQKDKYQVIESK